MMIIHRIFLLLVYICGNINMVIIMEKIVFVVMDGVGIRDNHIGDAVYNANTPNLDYIMNNYPMTYLKAHGTAVGLPTDNDMGNSEVGHNALGCGQIYSQGAKLVSESINDGSIYESDTFKEMINNCKTNNSTLHFIGLLSDGNVHSNINHLFTLLRKVKEIGIKKVRIHILLDGRDVEPKSALKYVDMLEEVIDELNDSNFDCKIASGGGRMKITMDRYQADWNMVKLGYEAHILGIGRMFKNAKEAIETYRSELDVIDQDLPGFVIENDGEPVGKVADNDSVLLFNFRGDRALEISMALEDEVFNYFERRNFPKIFYAGMLEYDGDLHIPNKYLVNPPRIKNTLTEVLIKNNINEFAISETQKYGHITYFWNGNRSEKFDEDLETYMEIPSDNVPFDTKPEMKAYEITDALIEAIDSNKYEFLRVNYANGDMVGHTGNYEAAIKAVETVDICIGKLLEECNKKGYTLVVTADHGNSDEMYFIDKDGNKVIKTSHTLNKVPFVICNNKYKIKYGNYGLANVGATILKMYNIDKPDSWEDSMI